MQLIVALVLCGCVSESAYALLEMGGGFTPLLIGKVLLAQVASFLLLETFEGSAGILAFSFYLGGVLGLVLMLIGRLHYSNWVYALYASYLVLGVIILRQAKKRAAARDDP
jgi:hypothetical protein